jgi:hypothetical protein
MSLALPTPAFTVERCATPALGWAAYAVDPAGGVGPRSSPVFESLTDAVRWALIEGDLIEPHAEAA